MQLVHGETSVHLTLRILHPLQARLPIFRSPIALEALCLAYSNFSKNADVVMAQFRALGH